MRKIKNISNHKEIRKIHSFTAKQQQNQTQLNPKVLFKGTQLKFVDKIKCENQF